MPARFRLLVAARLLWVVLPFAGEAAAGDGKFFPLPGRGGSDFRPVAHTAAHAGASEPRFFPIERSAPSPRRIDRTPSRAAPAADSTGSIPPPMVHRPRNTMTAALLPPAVRSESAGAIRRTDPASREPEPGMATGGVRLWPVETTVTSRVSSPFGWRLHPVTGRRAFHEGVDIAAPTGTGVVATAAGVVHAVGEHPRLGRYVMLAYFDGSMGTYGHLRDIAAKTGDTVERGERIGTVGSSGRSTGPHLDYALRIDGEAVDPLPMLNLPVRLAGR